MPDKDPNNIRLLLDYAEQILQAAIFAVIGVAVGIGQLLASAEVLTPRIIVGRALSTGGLGMVAGLAVVWIPDVPLVAQIGLAAAIASLGTSGLERVFQRIIGGR